MRHEQETSRALYRKLLAFYPPGFREQFGDGMAQTFADVCNERRRRIGRTPLGFILWLFVETGIGIMQERARLMSERTMTKRVTTIAAAALIGVFLVLPFVILEITHTNMKWNSAPYPLFGVLWLVPTLFILILVPLVRTARAGGSILTRPLELSVRLVLLAFFAWFWASLVIDQLPCFLGVPNCD